MDAAYELSNFIVNTRFADLPQEAIDVAKKEVLDVLAIALGGSRDKAVRELYGLVKEWGGREESTVIALGGRVPSPNAALVNSTMSNVLDYDDTHERGHLHAGIVVVPSAFAVSEAKGAVSGRDFIEAICVAVELGCRLGMATQLARPIFMGGWCNASLFGYFTSAAVAGKILNLDEQKMHNALGIAYAQASGNTQANEDGADSKRIGRGFAARGGITSALMAQRGITGAKNIFDESERSFYNLYHAGCNRDTLLKDLGKKFEMSDMSFKPYPCCRLNHCFIDAITKLVKDNKIEAEEVEEIVPFTCKPVYEELCLPVQIKTKPKSMLNAQFSLRWTIACGVVRKRVGVSEFTEEALKDRTLLNMAAKVNPVLDSSLPDELAFTKIKVRTKRGIFEINTDYTLGSVQNPMNFEDIEKKFIDCAAFSARPIRKERLTQVTHMVKNLEDVKNIEEIIYLLA
ncbi:MmgE/PrpD family protein [Chloroflexota bacterium]